MLKEMINRMTLIFKYQTRATLLMTFIGLAIILSSVFVAVFSHIIAPYNPLSTSTNILAPPSSVNLMGTDKIGRDVFSRIIYGTKISLSVAIISVTISTIIGTVLGLISGYIGNKIDMTMTSLIDVIYAFPSFLMALIIAVMLGPNLINISIAISVPGIASFYRLTRSMTLSLKERLLVEVERSLGASDLYIILHHVLPNCISSILVLMSLRVCSVILSIVGLGFLGVGIPPPTPEWGTDINIGRYNLLSGAYWVVIFPGLAIFLLVSGFNLLSTGVNNMLDPKRRRR